MKIVYVAKKYNYGKLEGNFSYAHYNFYETLKRMDGGKHQIIYFPIGEIIKKEGKEKKNKELLGIVEKEKPDLVFFTLNFIDSTDFEKETIREISKRAITLNWFTDDHWQFDKFSKYWARYFTWVATTDSQAPAKYHKIGYKNVIKTQWACNHYFYKALDLPKIYDVSFIGQHNGHRKKIIKEIERAGIKVNCWGRGWSAGRISYNEIFKVFAQSKINLNFSKNLINLSELIPSIFFQRRYDRSIKATSPKHWIDNFRSAISVINRTQIKGRPFEVLGCRGFLLTDYADDITNYYQDKKEAVYFESPQDLIEKIKYYLEHEEEREKIAEAGYQTTLREHTFENRFNEIFRIMRLMK